MLHAGFTASFSMAKNDKKALIQIFHDTHALLDPYLSETDPEKFKKMMSDGQLHGRLLDNGDKIKYGLYRKMIDVMKKYDQVLHSTNMKNASESMKTRISATGSELMYFAVISQYMQSKLKKLLSKMRKHNLNKAAMKQITYYDKLNNALFVLEQDVTPKLIAEYEKKSHNINKTIINNPISYWTYQFFPDAYFSEAAYKLLQSK